LSSIYSVVLPCEALMVLQVGRLYGRVSLAGELLQAVWSWCYLLRQTFGEVPGWFAPGALEGRV
jgi:hypothetical protein